MCVGIPGQVVSVGTDHPDLATVDFGGTLRLVNVGLLDEPVAGGDWVLVHMGFALSTMTADGAARALDAFREERAAEGSA